MINLSRLINQSKVNQKKSRKCVNFPYFSEFDVMFFVCVFFLKHTTSYYIRLINFYCCCCLISKQYPRISLIALFVLFLTSLFN